MCEIFTVIDEGGRSLGFCYISVFFVVLILAFFFEAEAVALVEEDYQEGMIYLNYKIIANIIDENIMEETITATLKKSVEKRDLRFLLGSDSKNIEIYVDGKKVNFTLKKLGPNYVLRFPLSEKEITSYTIYFQTSQNIVFYNNSIDFRLSFKPASFIRLFEVILEFPPGYTLLFSHPQGRYVIYPEAIVESGGDSIVIRWKRENMPAQKIFFAYATATRNNLDTAKGIGYRKPIGLDSLFIFILTVLTFFLGIYFGRRTSKKSDTELYVFLKEDEKAIVDLLKESGYEISQNIISKKLNISKAKLSRILLELEERNIIIRKRTGTVNMVRLII